MQNGFKFTGIEVSWHEDEFGCMNKEDIHVDIFLTSNKGYQPEKMDAKNKALPVAPKGGTGAVFPAPMVESGFNARCQSCGNKLYGFFGKCKCKR